jgi:hypothetical protein
MKLLLATVFVAAAVLQITAQSPAVTPVGHDTVADVQAGESRRLQKGDVMVIPAGIPPWFKAVSPTINYLTVKVIKP